jgi:hypothetical protein
VADPQAEVQADRLTAQGIANMEAQAQVTSALTLSTAHSITQTTIASNRLAADQFEAQAQIIVAANLASDRVAARATEGLARTFASAITAEAHLGAVLETATARVNASILTSAAQVAAAVLSSDTRIQVAQAQADSEIAATQVAASARLQAATITLDAQTLQAVLLSTTRIQVSQAQADAQVVSTEELNAARILAARIRSGAAERSSDLEALTRVEVNQTESTTQLKVSTIGSTATRKASDLGLADRLYAISANEAAQDYAADEGYDARIRTASIDATATRYSADRGLAGDQLQEHRADGRLNLILAFAGSKFDILFPFVQKAAEPYQGPPATLPTPGFSLDIPPITVVGIGPPDPVIAIGQDRNASLSALESSVSVDSVKARGFAPSGALASAIRSLHSQQSAANNIDAESSARVTHAPLDSDAFVAQQGAALELFDGQQSAVVASDGNQVQRQVGILEAVARMISGISDV